MSKKLLAALTAGYLLAGVVGEAHATPIISAGPAPTYDIQARARNGNSGFEAVLFTPGNPAGVTLNAAGAPAWSYANYHLFEFTYTAATGTSVWKIDFNRDGDFLDTQEAVTSISPTLAGYGFNYIDLFGQGTAAVFASAANFTVNGTNFGNFATNAVTQSFSLLLEESSGLFSDITASGSLNFSGNGGQERPRLWVQLGGPEVLPAETPVPEPATMTLLGFGMAALAAYGKKRKQNIV